MFFRRKLVTRTLVPELQSLLACWALSRKHHEFCRGATDAEIVRSEQVLGRTLPVALRALYEMSNGLSLVGANLNIFPLESGEDDELALVSASMKLREWGWNVPDELLVFGDDGSESLFGIWLPRTAGASGDGVIIELGECESMAIAGSSLCRFLRGRTGYYLLSEDAPEAALDALGLPRELRNDDPDDEVVALITRWADPDIEDPLPDPYESGITAAELRARFGSL